MRAMPAEKNIREALLALKPSPGMFQRFAEDFMRIKGGAAYQHIVPQGRNAIGQPTKGYPDAYARQANGDKFLIETTVGNWRNHVTNEDIPGITALGGQAKAFSLFVLEDGPNLIPQKNANPAKAKLDVDHYRLQLQALGIPADSIEFWFLDTLVKELCRPAYLAMMADLHLPTDVAPFTEIRELPYGAPGLPTRVEYENGTVVAKQRITELMDKFSRSPIILMEGRGGVGKSTLAKAAAHQWIKKGKRTAFYIDVLDQPTDTSQLVTTVVARIKEFGSKNTLFIIDGQHRLTSTSLSQIGRAFIDKDSQPCLLFVGKKSSSEQLNALQKSRGTLEKFELRIEAGDLNAVYELHARRAALSEYFPRPQPEDLDKWHGLALDMVMFRLALASQTKVMKAGYLPDIRREDAKRYFRETYLENSPPEEQKALACIALCARHEMPASFTSLGEINPQHFVERGLVTESVTKNERQRRFRLAHDNLGGLILECLGVDEPTLWQELLGRDPFQACFVIRRLLDDEAKDEAKDEAAKLLRQIEDQLWHFSPRFSLGYAPVIGALYKETGVHETFWDYVGERVGAYIDGSDEPLQGVAAYLTFASGRSALIDDCWQQIRKLEVERFRKACRYLSPGGIVGLLEAAYRHGELTFTWISESISDSAIARAIANNFAALSPDHAESLLEAFARLTPVFFCDTLCKTIADGRQLDSYRTDLHEAGDSRTLEWLRRRPRLFGLVLDSIGTTRFAQALAASRLRSLAFVLNGQHQASAVCTKLVPEVLNALYAAPSFPSGDRRESALRIELIVRHAGQCDKKQFKHLFAELVRRKVLAESVKVMSCRTLATLLSDAAVNHGGLAESAVQQAVIPVVQARMLAYASRPPSDPEEMSALHGLCSQTGLQAGPQAAPRHERDCHQTGITIMELETGTRYLLPRSADQF